MLDGSIWLKSEENKGSIFYFSIPNESNCKGKSFRHQEVFAESKDIIKKIEIVIAEDDEISQKLLENYIRNLASKIINVRTGIDAVDICRQNPNIDLILMDISLPIMGGYEATQKIRKFNKDVVIIAQTAYGLSGDRDIALKSGCNDYIAKPFSKAELVNLIQKHFGSR